MNYTIVVTLASLLVFAGRTASQSAWQSDERLAGQDSLQQAQLTTQDVIDLSKEGVSDSIIISQMRATHTRFALTAGDIVDLTKAGVSKQVIIAMIQSANQPSGEPPYAPYWYDNPYPVYYYGYWWPYGWGGHVRYYGHFGYHGVYPRGGIRLSGRHR